MRTIAPIAEAVQGLLTNTANELGRETGFIQRRRQVSGASFAQTVVFGYLANPASSREAVHQVAATIGLKISPPGLDKRFSQRAAIFLKGLVEAAIELGLVGEEDKAVVGQQLTRIRVVDTSQIALPAALAEVWPGCGGSNQQATARVKIGVEWEVSEGRLCGLSLSSGRVHDQKTGIVQSESVAGSLYLRDLGFFNLEQMKAEAAQGAYFISRLKVGTCLADRQGKAIHLAVHLGQTTSTSLDETVLIGSSAELSGRMVAFRVPAKIAQARRRQLRQRGRKKKQAVSAERLALADWSIFITNIPAWMLTLEAIAMIVRWRWQIELLFKLWKSAGLLDEWRPADPWRLLCEFYAKLLGLLVQPTILLVSEGQPLRQSLPQAAQVIRKQAFHLASVLADDDRLACALATIAQTLTHSCQRQRRQTLPLAFQFWEQCFCHP